MTMSGKLLGAAGALAALCFLAATPASADSIELRFTRIVSALEWHPTPDISNQLFVEIADTDKDGNLFTPNDSGNNLVRFTFRNEVGVNSSISEIYFDDGTLLGISTLINDPNFTDFVPGSASPGNLPGGQNLDPPFETTQGFLADAQGNPSNGIDQASERVHIYFELKEGQTYADLLNAVQLGGAEGGLRIGLHVRSIGDHEESASFVSVIPVVPTPGAAAGGLALLGLIASSRRRALA